MEALFARHVREQLSSAPRDVTHTEHGLSYILEGEIALQLGGPVRATAGSLVVVPAGVPHGHAGGDAAEFWMAGFCAACLGLDESQLLMAPYQSVRGGALPVFPVAKRRRARVVRLFRELRDECVRGAPESADLARCLLVLLLGELRRAVPRRDAGGVSGSLVGDALEFIQRHALQPISLREVAAAVHRSPSHVTTAVRKATGYPVAAWIAAARVVEAARWLVHSDDSLDAITERVGWSDKTHFIRQFKKAYGVTPAAYRRDRHSRPLLMTAKP